MKNRWKAWVFILFIGLTRQAVAQINTFPSSGSVGIGTTSPLANTSNLGLHIDKGSHSTLLLGDPVGHGFGGIIQTTDSKHRIFIGANIYDDSNLPHLQELEAFIQQNKHLPQIPSAEEMKQNGVKVGELQMKLLQKIEELTLYIIEQRKQKSKRESQSAGSKK